jgi:UDP-GlcNAc:undecaprenyl-phosphate/decaprenyl-phosphate GlcNAc-1-phosphate transferase
MAEILLCFSWALVISMFSIPSIMYVAEAKQLLNFPNDRTTHLVSVPRLGGLAIFGGFVSAVMIFGKVNHDVQYLLAGCLVLFYIAIKDDLVHVSAFKKFFVQILATGILVFLGDFKITNFQGLFGIYELDYGVSYAFTMVVITAITNSINLIDGIDGLAGTLVVTIILMVASALFFVESELPMVLVAVSMAGAVLGFLRYNFNNAKIFMGDTGSLICGFVVAALLVRFIEKVPHASSPILAMSIIFVPIVDTVRITFIRLLDGKSPFMSDKNHIHHRLLFAGAKPVFIVLMLSLLNLAVFLLFLFLDGVNITINFYIFVAVLFLAILAFHFLKDKSTQA